MDLGIAGKTAVVTGASAGLGFASAFELAEAGCNVAICARSQDGVDRAVKELARHATGRVVGRALDISEHAAVAEWVEQLADELGPPQIMIANAGGPPVGAAGAVTMDQYRAALELNLLASINLAEIAVPYMREAGWGRILFVASISAKEPVPTLALSNTARAGLLGYSKSLSIAVARDGVTVNVLAPGYTRTARLIEAVGGEEQIRRLAGDQIPLGRVGEPEEFSAAAAFLASARASFITGTVLAVDGGSTSSLF